MTSSFARQVAGFGPDDGAYVDATPGSSSPPAKDQSRLPGAPTTAAPLSLTGQSLLGGPSLYQSLVDSYDQYYNSPPETLNPSSFYPSPRPTTYPGLQQDDPRFYAETPAPNYTEAFTPPLAPDDPRFFSEMIPPAGTPPAAPVAALPITPAIPALQFTPPVEQPVTPGVAPPTAPPPPVARPVFITPPPPPASPAPAYLSAEHGITTGTSSGGLSGLSVYGGTGMSGSGGGSFSGSSNDSFSFSGGRPGVGSYAGPNPSPTDPDYGYA
jgi:hypothetical protein